LNTTYVIVLTVALLLLIGVVIALASAGRRRSKNLQQRFGPEYDRIVQETGSQKAAEAELEQRRKHVENLNIRPLTKIEHDRYLVDWTAVQSKFVDDPAQAIKDADRLIIEVMLVRNYPMARFEERAADISVNYPELVSNYRAAHEIAQHNEQQAADTEELRQAMVHYRSLFNQLLETEQPAVEMEKLR
jgi:hypothetical protein